MKTNQIVGIIFIVNAFVIGFLTKSWLIGIPMAVVGLCYLTGLVSDDE
ncbi:hypothetical protein [Streptococcus sp. SS-4456]